MEQILTGTTMPFCPGCGHAPSVISISKALKELGYAPNDVVMVSDIGCAGLVDPLFNTHTIHGLHGRSSALAFGVSHGLNDKSKKVMVILGDGGATIGLQHILESARRNADMTVLVLNNLIYGMTGGQVSGLSTNEFKDDRHIADQTPPFDVVRLAHEAGAPYSARVTSHKNFVEIIRTAFSTPGFSLVEISSLCQPYGAAKMDELTSWTEEEEVYTNKRRELAPPFVETNSLISDKNVIHPQFESKVGKRYGIILAGSAGGGVQAAGKLLANTGLISGLDATMKGEYPITIGTGFSVAEVILSRDQINYTGLVHPDLAIILTIDGLEKIKDKLRPDTKIIADSKLNLEGYTNVTFLEFGKIGGKKGAVFSALTYWMIKEGLINKEALKAAAGDHKYSESLLATMTKMEEAILAEAN
jgi:pyruvate/2-oxoacid:ferredoxin oxidoreductase beta subunit/Pyruvate/2-oxoacid:ferredoxin oxidoreductase gamma subunit